MAISTYSELKTEIAAWIHRDDLTSKIVDFVTLGELHLNHSLRLSNMDVEANISVTSGSDSATLPTRFIEPIHFRDDEYEKIELVSAATLYAYQNGSAVKPTHYAISTQIDFPDNADASYTYVMRYIKGWDIATDTTNWLLTNSPDAYLYSCLSVAGMYVQSPLVQQFISMRDMAINSLQRSDNSIRNKPKLRTEIRFGGSQNILAG